MATDYNANTITKKAYPYARVCVHNRLGAFSTISISIPEYEHLLHLATGSTLHPTLHGQEKVFAVCRDAARELIAEGYSGKLSGGVRTKAL